MRSIKALIAVALCSCLALSVRADDPKDKMAGGMDPKQMEEMMKQFMAMAAPGEQHKMLAMMIGDWNVENRMKMDPNAPEEVTKGTSKSTAALGGRWIVQDHKSSMKMGDKDMPFQGQGFMGYDNQKKKFISIWMDTMSTGAMMSYGDADASGKVITFNDEIDDPMMPGSKCKIRYVISLESPDKYTMDWYENRGQGESKTMTIIYTRAK